MTAPPPVLSPNSILPPTSSHCPFIPGRANRKHLSKVSLFHFFNILNYVNVKLTWNCQSRGGVSVVFDISGKESSDFSLNYNLYLFDSSAVIGSYYSNAWMSTRANFIFFFGGGHNLLAIWYPLFGYRVLFLNYVIFSLQWLSLIWDFLKILCTGWSKIRWHSVFNTTRSLYRLVFSPPLQGWYFLLERLFRDCDIWTFHIVITLK